MIEKEVPLKRADVLGISLIWHTRLPESPSRARTNRDQQPRPPKGGRGRKPIRVPQSEPFAAADRCEWAEEKAFPAATGSNRLPGQGRKAKTDHLVEGRFSVLLKFDDEARMAESEASGVDETCRECGVSQRKLA
jgi:hypothetical protein